MTETPTLSTTPPVTLNIPLPDGDLLPITLSPGEVLFMMGANGTGKSSLLHRLYSDHSSIAKRISAHRRTWLASGTVDITPQQKEQQESAIQQQDRNLQSRFQDPYEGQRTSVALFDLVDSEHSIDRVIVSLLRQGETEAAKSKADEESPLQQINTLLQQANFPLAISVNPGDSLLSSKMGSEPYSIAEMSDGERNAVLMAASVLTAAKGTLFVIDEPERHLHRSIITPLLASLFRLKNDCMFIIATHEVGFASDFPSARAVLLNACHFAGKQTVAWDASLIPFGAGITEELRLDILGSRRKILFVEGQESSLDKRLYALLFPEVAVVPKGSHWEVERAVKGVRDSQDLHWIEAYGLVDGDSQGEEARAHLWEWGIHALGVSSVEGILYHPKVQRLVARRQAEVTGVGEEALLQAAREDSLSAVASNRQHLARKVAERVVRQQLHREAGLQGQILDQERIRVEIDVSATLKDEEERLSLAIRDCNLETIVERYPIRESSTLKAIAEGLQFKSPRLYEQAALHAVKSDSDALHTLLDFFGPLADKIAKASTT